ncbi:hypothetical protein JVU11DRAFT_8172 [Chiua virens]|nr:hypothetical protein JVU11DRAFT_8172 [Chiua virens]
MPGPKNKQKNKSNAKAQNHRSTRDAERIDSLGNFAVNLLPTFVDTYSHLCLTLKKGQSTRCDQLATEGHTYPNRCKVHHGQFRILCEKYKNAQEVVDALKQEANLPTKEQMSRYTDWRAALEKAQWVRKYLEALRVERRGLEIHEQRFLLRVDDGHRHRLRMLEEEMITAIVTLNALHERACELYKDTVPALRDLAQSKVEEKWQKESHRSIKELVECTRNPDVFTQASLAAPAPPLILPMSEIGDEDLIDMSLTDQKGSIISALKQMISLEPCVEASELRGRLELLMTGSTKALVEEVLFVYQQLARRIIFYDPSLFMNSLDKVSFEDFILSDDLSMEDLVRFSDMFFHPMDFPLNWVKDAVSDALVMSGHGTVANIGSEETRVPLLGGWVFKRSSHSYYSQSSLEFPLQHIFTTS